MIGKFSSILVLFFVTVSTINLTSCSTPLTLSNSSRNEVAMTNKVQETKPVSTVSTHKETPETRFQILSNTCEGFILLVGWTEAKENGYDTSSLSNEEKAFFTDKGLSIIAKDADLKDFEKACPAVLSSYYYNDKKDYKKAMYWAFRGAEKGSPECMSILTKAYSSGNGMVQDFAEAIKWKYLGAAVGGVECKQWVKENGTSGITNEYVSHFFLEGQKRANQWTLNHPEIFISAN